MSKNYEKCWKMSKKLRKNVEKSFKNVEKSLRFLGVNAASIKSKLLTFKKVISELEPSLFFIEETKLKNTGTLKMENYTIFELTRTSKNGGGGLALGCVKDLHPTWVWEGNDEVEALSIKKTSFLGLLRWGNFRS